MVPRLTAVPVEGKQTARWESSKHPRNPDGEFARVALRAVTGLGITPRERLKARVYSDERGTQKIRLTHQNGVVIFRPGTATGFGTGGQDWPDVASLLDAGVDLADLDLDEEKPKKRTRTKLGWVPLDTKAAATRAVAKFDPMLHPRDRTGRFIRTDAIVRLLGYRGTGRVTGLPGNNRVQVLRDDGVTVVRDHMAVTVIREPDGAVAVAPHPPASAGRVPVTGRTRVPEGTPKVLPQPVAAALTTGMAARHPADTTPEQRKAAWRANVDAITARMVDAPDDELLSAPDLAVLTRVRADPEARVWRVNFGSVHDRPDTYPTWEAMTPAEKAEAQAGQQNVATWRQVDAETFRAAARGRAVASRIGIWGVSSNDAWPRSIALQETASAVFGLGGARGWALEDSTRSAADADKAANSHAHPALLRAEHTETQKWFRDHHLTEVTLYRVQAWTEGRDEIPPWATSGQTQVDNPAMRPISAWTADPQVAREFLGAPAERPGEVQVLLSATFPADRVLSTPRTGSGSLQDSEFLVLHGPGTVAVEAWYGGSRVTPGGLRHPTPVDAASLGGQHAPEASPAGAPVFFMNPTGIAWTALDRDGRETGWLRTDFRDKATTVRYDHDQMDRWAAEVDERGMTEVTSPYTDPADALAPRPDPGRQVNTPSLPGTGSSSIAGYSVDPALTVDPETDTVKDARHRASVDAAARMTDVPTGDMLAADVLPRPYSWMTAKDAAAAMAASGNTPAPWVADPAGWLETATPEQEAEVRRRVVTGMMNRWSATSNDHDPWALAVQEAAHDLWGGAGDYPWETDEALTAKVTDTLARNRPLIDSFLRAQHEMTQEWFAARNITHVHVWRGLRVPDDQVPDWGAAAWDTDANVTTEMRPLGSWTVDPRAAQSYATTHLKGGVGFILDGTIPIERVASTGWTGMGDPRGRELVVIGGPGQWTAQRADDPMRSWSVKVRHVRTPAGVETFHEPIGSPIVPHPHVPSAPAVTAAPLTTDEIAAEMRARYPRIDASVNGRRYRANGGEFTMTQDEMGAMWDYFGYEHTRINAALRAGRRPPEVRGIDSALTRAPLDRDMILYRGGHAPAVGGTVTDRAFLSTTLDEDLARHYATTLKGTETGTKHGTVLRIRVPAGTPAFYREARLYWPNRPRDYEREVLLARGLTIRVTGQRETVEGVPYVDAEVVRDLPHPHSRPAVSEASRLSVKVRHVRTPEGARQYGEPVGSPILVDVHKPARPRLHAVRDPAPVDHPAAALADDIPGTRTMRPITDREKTELRYAGKKIPPGWTDVHVTDTPGAALLVVAKDAKGRRQGIYSAAHTAGQAAKKFARQAELVSHLPDLDAALTEGAGTDDAAAALLLIRKLGLRPGSTTDTGATKQAFGATTLQARHVTMSAAGRVSFRFVGKDGVDIALDVDDPQVAAALGPRLKGKSGTDPLFDTTDGKVTALFKAHVPAGLKVKDLRTLKANVTALAMIADDPGQSKDEKEFKARRRKVAVAVSKVLGNTPTIALNSYLNPALWTAWLPEPVTP